jgi:hypothetical protein
VAAVTGKGKGYLDIVSNVRLLKPPGDQKTPKDIGMYRVFRGLFTDSGLFYTWLDAAVDWVSSE